MLVAAGERLAADGRVVEGASGMDIAFLTGESAPVRVGPGDAVFFVCGKQKDGEKFAGLAHTQDYFRCLPRKPAMSSQ